MNAYYTYREITCKAELIQYFKYRYQQFTDVGFLEKDDVGIDIDAYDLRARHFGLFRVEGKCEIMVGGHRLINEINSSVADLIKEIALEYFDNIAFMKKDLFFPQYMMSISKYGGYIMKEVSSLKSQGKQVGESSRFFILSTEKSIQLLKFFEVAIISLALFVEQIEIAITSCGPKITRFQQIFGFELISGTDLEKINGLDSYNLILSKENIPETFLNDISKMEAAFKEHQKIYFHPQSPGYYNSKQTLKIPLNDGKLVDAA